MENRLILIEECCTYYKVDKSFIEDLTDLGLIEITEAHNNRYLADSQLPNLEKFAEWHYDLEISPAGIDTIQELLDKMRILQEQIMFLENKLKVLDYKDDDEI